METGEDKLCTRLLEALSAFEEAQRRYYPGISPHLRERFAPLRADLEAVAAQLTAGAGFTSAQGGAGIAVSPENTVNPGIVQQSPNSSNAGVLVAAARLCAEALASATVGDDFQDAFINFMRASRRTARVKEMLFPLIETVPAVNLFFLEEPVRARAERILSRGGTVPAGELVNLGLDEDPYARGGCSLFMPPPDDSSRMIPLVIALHGGYGHGRDFLWVWLRQARSRRFVLAAPSSSVHTWSILGADTDVDVLTRVLRYVMDRRPVDPANILLTGMSDGGTYSLIQAMNKETPYRAFAPVAGVLAPFDVEHVRGRRFFWVHGARDWMFPWQYAKAGAQRLSEAGADVTLRIVPDLYHAYPVEENDRILQWFDPALALAAESI